ncbi:alpha/beta hydrolase [Metabacillus idriensis]|uniref:alpha/beta hydrolase n=1 Tax=Metabacillus idriensis TaxID=324768 RepID=UPI001748D5C2|nr:alpha/beta hydrolase [Metabacillus idriensis]
MKRFIKNFLLGALAVLILGFGGFYIWSQITYSPSEELYNTANLQDQKETNEYLIFEPENQKTDKGIILYPGAKVEPEAYAYLADQLSQKGYTAVIPKMPFNLAIAGIDKADTIIKNLEQINNWYIGGHSQGGAAASIYAFEHQEEIKGLFLLAAYPTNSSDFSNTDFPMLTIYAEHDGISTLEDINKTKHLLSDYTFFHKINGGNHAQFGMYGEQKGDNKADINVFVQQDQIIREINNWIERIEKR